MFFPHFFAKIRIQIENFPQIWYCWTQRSVTDDLSCFISLSQLDQLYQTREHWPWQLTASSV